MKKLLVQICLVVFIIPSLAFGQIAITFPSDRVVFQRDNSNNATLNIAGYFSGCVDRIEARFVPRVAGQGIATPASGWQTIQTSPLGGNFYGSMVVTGGWYKLEVRSILDNTETGSSTIEHVGIGEVFVVAGQSNATGGDSNANGPGSTDDRVSSVNFQNVNNNYPGVAPYSAIKLPCPEFVHLDADTKTAPFGNYAWCWGAFGDELVKKINVPVMIFNAGWSSTGIRNWQETINSNNVTTSEFSYTFPAGLPFGHLRLALNNYVAQLGVRAVLWHQGETDNLANRTETDYLKDIREVIQATRDLSGKSNLAWVVSRVSRFTVDGASRTWQPVIDAQNDVIGIGSHGSDPAFKMPAVFPGPETDNYWDSNYRSDEIHFSGAGLIHLAEWWTDKLNSDFFQQSTPYPSIPPPNILVSRSETANVVFEAPAGAAVYNWLSPDNCNDAVSNSQQWTASSGDFKLKVIDNNNNTVFSPRLRVPNAVTISAISKNTDVAIQKVHTGDNNLLATDCRIIAKLLPSANTSLINETLTIKTLIDASVGVQQQLTYVQRHFDMKSNANNFSSKLTLFFAQSEFDSFNAISKIPIPKNPTDEIGKDNLRIVYFGGNSSDGSLGSYNGNRTELTPTSVLWNATLNSWEVSFEAANAGGYFISTSNSALPVTLKYFEGKSDNQSVSLEWATTSENNASHFDIERSNNAISFVRIGKIKAAGDSKALQQYRYNDSNLPAGNYYYRLKQVDTDNSYEFSRIISLKITKEISVQVFPNPVSDRLSIQSEIEINSVEIINSSGKTIGTHTPNSHFYILEMSPLPLGLYIIRINGVPYKIVKK